MACLQNEPEASQERAGDTNATRVGEGEKPESQQASAAQREKEGRRRRLVRATSDPPPSATWPRNPRAARSSGDRVARTDTATPWP